MSETEDSEVSIHSENEINKIKTHSDIKKNRKDRSQNVWES